MKLSSSNIVIFACFILLGLAMLYPMPLDPTHLVAKHDGTRDSFFFFWNFWWTKEALFNLHTSPFATDYLFYPEGTSLVFHPLAFAHSLVALPFLAVFGDVQGGILAYNIFIILSYGLSGLGMYLLVRHLGGNRGGAFVAGLIFSFSSYHLWNLERLNILSIELLPLFAYFFLRTIDADRKRDALLCGLILSLTLYTALPYFLYLMIFSIMYSLFVMLRKPRQIAPGLPVRAAAAAVFCLLSFPYAYGLYREYFRNPHLVFPLIQSIAFSSDPRYVFLPNEYNPFYQKILGLGTPRLSPWAIATSGSFLGFTAVALSIYAAVGPTRRRAAFWSLCALVFLILSFGPFLKWNGQALPVPLPYTLLRRWIPLLAISRAPWRYMAMVMMSVSVLSGLAVSRLSGEGREGRLRTILVPCLIGVLVMIENWMPPVLFTPHPIPQIYHEIAQDTDASIVVDAPIMDTAYLGNLVVESMYYQLAHKKRLLYGGVGRRTSTSSYIMSSPLLRLLRLDRDLPRQRTLLESPLDKTTVQKDREMLRTWGVKYIILHRTYLEVSDVKFLDTVLQEYDPVNVREDAVNGIIIYRLY